MQLSFFKQLTTTKKHPGVSQQLTRVSQNVSKNIPRFQQKKKTHPANLGVAFQKLS
jgi:hypothetical protein